MYPPFAEHTRPFYCHSVTLSGITLLNLLLLQSIYVSFKISFRIHLLQETFPDANTFVFTALHSSLKYNILHFSVIYLFTSLAPLLGYVLLED